MLQQLLEFKKSDRTWHFPLLAGMCVGLPLLAGYYTNNLQGGKLASLAALVILYIPAANLAKRMVTLMACSFGLMVSFLIGLLLSFNSFIAAAALGAFAAIVHVVLYYLKLTRPPGNFFFIMVASVAICLPFDLQALPQRIGFVGIGTMISCLLALVYSLFALQKSNVKNEVITVEKNKYINRVESVTFGVFVGLALLVAHLLHMQNPYWAPTSCVAVMQGASTTHIWQRSIQRISGTLIGLGITWVILLLQPPTLSFFIGIIVLQTAVEWLVVRNYGIAVIFITILTIFLAESGQNLIVDPTALIKARFFDIIIGSSIGAVGGWVLHNEHVRYLSLLRLRKTRQR